MQYEFDVESASSDTRQKIYHGRQADRANSLDNFDEQRRPWGFVAFVVTALMLVTAIDQRTEAPRHHVAASGRDVRAADGAEQAATSARESAPGVILADLSVSPMDARCTADGMDSHLADRPDHEALQGVLRNAPRNDGSGMLAFDGSSR